MTTSIRQLRDTKEQHELRANLFEMFSARSAGTNPQDRDVFKEISDTVADISCEVLQLYLSAKSTDEEHYRGQWNAC
jgi:hypothetical protein